MKAVEDVVNILIKVKDGILSSMLRSMQRDFPVKINYVLENEVN